MKKALLFALAGLFAAVAPALAYPPAAANVNFSSERGVPFGLVLDGRPLTRGVAREVHVDQLVPGRHWADFTVPTAYGGAVRFRSQVWLEPGLETTFVLIARPGRPLDLREVGAVALCQGPRGYGQGYAYDDDDDDNCPAPYPHYPYYGSHSNGGYYNAPNGNGNGYPNNGNGQPGSGNGTGYYPGSTTSSYRVLAPQEANGLVQAVQQQPLEASKLSTAKQALAQSSIQTEDLKRLLRSLDFEASRVELAEFAYPHVADPQNFAQVYEAFDSAASVQNVQRTVGAVARHERE